MHLSIKNYRGIQAAEIDAAPIAVLVGRGGSGKSSVAMAASAVLTGATLPAGVLKTGAGVLVRGGTAQGTAEAKADGWTATVTWPKADRRSEGTPPYVSLFAAGILSLPDMDPRERSTAVASYLKATPVKADLVAGMTPAFRVEVVDDIWSKIAGDGWDATWAFVKDRTARLKGQWEAATGERYGSDKGGKWLPQGWSADLQGASVESLEGMIVGAQAELDASIAEQATREASVRVLNQRILAGQQANVSIRQADVTRAEATAVVARRAIEDAIAQEAANEARRVAEVATALAVTKAADEARAQERAKPTARPLVAPVDDLLGPFKKTTPAAPAAAVAAARVPRKPGECPCPACGINLRAVPFVGGHTNLEVVR